MSDNEKLLKALVEDTDVNDFEPNTRFETMLKACCCGEDCGLEPKTRNEYLLKQLQEKLKGGSSVNPLQLLIDNMGGDGKPALDRTFQGYKGTSLDDVCKGLDISTITSDYYTFSDCRNLTHIPNLDFSNLKSYNRTFQGCQSLTSIKLKGNNVTGGFSYAFSGCYKVETIDLDCPSTGGQSYYGAFQNCYSLTKIIIRKIVNTVVGSGPATNGSDHTFKNCYHFDGTVHATYNPEGLRDGRIYVPDDKVEEVKAANGFAEYADLIVPLSTLEE